MMEEIGHRQKLSTDTIPTNQWKAESKNKNRWMYEAEYHVACLSISMITLMLPEVAPDIAVS